jgi:hypothetical protein
MNTPKKAYWKQWVQQICFIVLCVGACGTLQAAIALENITPSFIRHPLDSAYLVSAALKDSDKKAALTSEIAIKYALAGDPQIAFQIGFDLQKKFPESSYAALIFPEMGAALAKNGQRSDIISLLAILKDTSIKQLTSEYVALTYIQKRQLDIAQSFIREISNTAKRTRIKKPNSFSKRSPPPNQKTKV